PKVPVHGLLVDIETGKLDWIVNGYQAVDTPSSRWNEVVKSAGQTVDALKSLTNFNIGEMKFPETKIGETVASAENWIAGKIQQLEIKAPTEQVKPVPGAPNPVPPKIPMPQPVRPRIHGPRRKP